MSNSSDRIRQNVESVRGRIAAAARRSGRAEASVELVAVTKKWPAELVRPLVAAGVLDLGENYPQELWKKAEALADLEEPVRWHLIGHLQTNKARRTLPLVRMIHAVDSLKLLQLLDTLAREESNPPAICLQVNTSGEESKHGWSAEQDPRRRRCHRRVPEHPDRGTDDNRGLGHGRRDGQTLVRPTPPDPRRAAAANGPAASRAVDGHVQRFRGRDRGRRDPRPRGLGAFRRG